MQTTGSDFADRIDYCKKTKFELELIKLVFCSVEGHVVYTIKLASFKIKFL